MRPLIAQRGPVPHPQAAAHDPAPSIWTYRAQRLWLTPLFHKVLRLGLPVAVIAGAVSLYLGDEANRMALVDGFHEIKREIEDRPEFRVNVLGVDGAGPELTEEVRGAMALSLPISSFDLDLDELRQRVEALPAVASADLRLQSGGYLAVQITERVPVMVWQNRSGTVLIDGDGHFVAGVEERSLERPLPMVAGDGADRVVGEALTLYATAAPLGPQMLGLVRMGERRWDIVLQDGRRILLPETGAAEALDRILALNDVTELLSRDVLRVDLRNPERLSVQLSPEALEEFRRIQALDPQSL